MAMREIGQISERETPPLAQYSHAEVVAGESLFKRPCTFLKGVVAISGLPETGLCEVAFAGRSNVGKSSLINALVGTKSLARTSNTPGRTREVNYFVLGYDVYLVDLPGYGYAKAPKAQVKGWNRLIGDFLKGRVGLKRVFLLIDSRHGLKDADRATMKLMDEAAVSYQGVLTKSDKLKSGAMARMAAKTAEEMAKHPAAFPGLIATSAAKGTGIAELRAAVAKLAAE
ncbi:MAG: ribosome biogenesis GTP-binding protein YihA/YsxC [Pseudomonadota bacterium]|nr:ribosome biogenesis GTP-binding protein YihA/YsxC [Pseudomonadota bacterium]